jgi:hypothetical protein
MEKGGIEGSCDSQNLWRAMAKERPEMPAPAMMIFLPAKKAELDLVVFVIVFSVSVVYEMPFVGLNMRGYKSDVVPVLVPEYLVFLK